MPNFDYECACGHVEKEVFCHADEFREDARCELCNTAMIRVYDSNAEFKCKNCGHKAMKKDCDVVTREPQRSCVKCGDEMTRVYTEFFRAQIHTQLSTLGYGQYHPQAGEVIRDYAHKRELMKKFGWEEGNDPVKGNRKLSEEAFHDDGQPDPHDTNIEWGTEDMIKGLPKNANAPIDIG